MSFSFHHRDGPCGSLEDEYRRDLGRIHDGMIKPNENGDCPTRSSTNYPLVAQCQIPGKLPGAGKRNTFGPNAPLVGLGGESQQQQKQQHRLHHDSFIDMPSAFGPIQRETADPLRAHEHVNIHVPFSRMSSTPSTPQRTSSTNGLPFPHQQERKLPLIHPELVIRSPPIIAHSPGSSFSVVKKLHETNVTKPSQGDQSDMPAFLSPNDNYPQHYLNPTMTCKDPSPRQVPLTVLSPTKKSCLTPGYEYPTHDDCLREQRPLPCFTDRYDAGHHHSMLIHPPTWKAQSTHLSYEDHSLLFLQPPSTHSSYSIVAGKKSESEESVATLLMPRKRENDVNVRRPAPHATCTNHNDVTKNSRNCSHRDKIPMEIFVPDDDKNDCKPGSFHSADDSYYNQSVGASLLSDDSWMDPRDDLRTFLTKLSNCEDNVSALTGDSEDESLFFLALPWATESTRTDFRPWQPQYQQQHHHHQQQQQQQLGPNNLPCVEQEDIQISSSPRKYQRTLSTKVPNLLPSVSTTIICSCNNTSSLLSLSGCNNCNQCLAKVGHIVKRLPLGQRQDTDADTNTDTNDRQQDSKFTFVESSSTIPSSSSSYSLSDKNIKYQRKCGSVILKHAPSSENRMNENSDTGDDIVTTPPVTVRVIENPPLMNKNKLHYMYQ